MKTERAGKVALAAVFAAAMATLMLAGPDAFAHSFLDRSEPSAASVFEVPPTEVEAHFDNPLDPAGSKLRVLNENGDEMSAGKAAVSADHQTLTLPLKPLAPGQYFVKWSALSADGDRAMGAFSFTVRGALH